MQKIRIIFTRILLVLIIATLALGITTSDTFAKDTQSKDVELFLVAQKAFEDGFYDVAIRYITQLLEEYPESVKQIQTKLLLGQCYFFKSQYLKAYEVFEELLQYSEFKDATLYWLGETYLKGSDYTQAEEQYKKLIDLYPKSIYTPQAYYSLGWVYFEQYNFAQAKDSFLKLIKNFPTHQLSEDASFKVGECEYNLKEYNNTITYFKDYITKYSNSRRHAEAYFLIAESYYYLEEPLSAISFYAKAADIALDNKLVLMSKISLGWSYLKVGKHELSKQNFDEALAFSQEKGILTDDVYLGQASLYSEMDNHAEAHKAFDQLIKKFPKSSRIAEAYLGKANSLYAIKKYEEAIGAYQTIIDRYKDDKIREEVVEKAYFGLAWSQLKSNNIDQSIKSFEAIKDKTENKIVKISALTQIGDAYQDNEQYEKAIEVYDEILRDYPDSPYTDYVQYRQGVTLLKMEKMESAKLSFQSLSANFPDSKYLKDTKYYLAVAYFNKGDWAIASNYIQEFIKDLSIQSEFAPEAYYIFALSQYNLNEFDDALKTFQKIIKNFPTKSDLVRNAELGTAKCIYKKGEIEEAIKKFRMLTLKYPQSQIAQDSLVWLGDHYLSVSEFDNAIITYQQFIDNFPGSDKLNLIYFELSRAFEAKEEFDQAINVLKKIDDPTDRELYVKAKLAIADIFSREVNSQSALETYENIVLTSPEFKRDAYLKIADVKKDKRNYKGALEAYSKALEAEQGLSKILNAQLQFQIADTYEILNDQKKAVDEYLKIPYLYPNDKPWIVKAYLRVARVFEDQEKWTEAKTIYEKIIALEADELKFAQERLEWIAENTLDQTL